MIDSVAIRKLELQPQEAFLLSRIDGSATLGDLCLMCGVELCEIREQLERLIRMRVLTRLDHARPQSKTVKLSRGNVQTTKLTREVSTTMKISRSASATLKIGGEASGAQRAGRGASRTVKIPGVEGPPDEQPTLERSPGNKSLRQRAKTRKMQILRRQIHAGSRRSEPADRVPLVSVSVDPQKQARAEAAQAQRADKKAQRTRSASPGRKAQNGARPRSTTQAISVSKPPVILCWEAQEIDESKLDKSLAISVERQRALLQMTSLLHELDPFELLAMAYSDDAAEIRRAFHQQSRWLHPDAYHGKELGPYRDMLEQLFAKVRQAYDELQCEQARQRYAATG